MQQQLGVLREPGASLLVHGQGRLPVVLLHSGADEIRVGEAVHPVLTPRGLQAAAQVVGGHLALARGVEVGHPQVEEDERVLRVLPEVPLQEGEVTPPPLRLAFLRPVVVAVMDGETAADGVHSGAQDGPEKLLVEVILEAEVGPVGPELHLVHDVPAVPSGPGGTRYSIR